jgi:hypothetical protein
MRALLLRTSVWLAVVVLAIAPLLASAHVHAATVEASADCARCAVAHHGVADVAAPPAVAPGPRHVSRSVCPPLAPAPIAAPSAAVPRGPPVPLLMSL